MDWVYLKGCENDFYGAPEWATHLAFCSNDNPPVDTGTDRAWVAGLDLGSLWVAFEDNELKGEIYKPEHWFSIAHRTPRIGYDLDLEFCKDNTDDPRCVECAVDESTQDANKYQRSCKGVMIDVYDVLQAWNVTNPALQHLIKKALCPGERGHKDRQEDLQDILDSAKRAIELEKE
ncbi:hypothetical protein [Leclercia sp.]|uniref:hypothetical protein n=1 Tax=Leclercia sp. TaxID=1898428 RepID=UPI0028AFE1FE|nr:hypothetical protein [Leclercia sp.]